MYNAFDVIMCIVLVIVIAAIIALAGMLVYVGIHNATVDLITEGEVINKTFTPAHSSVQIIPIVTSNGKTTSTTMIPYVYYYDDKWEITIQDYNEDAEEMETATYRVTEEVYNSVEIGAEFIYSEDMQPNTPEYTRERE